jgi:hypothetical protein
MAITPFKTWVSGEVLTASDLNASFSHITSNADALISPLSGALDMNGYELILDADADTSITADTDDLIDFKLAGQDLFKMNGTTASVVNGLTLFATATGSRPYIVAHGSDSSIGLEFRPKGASGVLVFADHNGNEVIKTAVGTASAVNEVTVTNAATGAGPSIAATGGDTNINLVLEAKGGAAFALQTSTGAAPIVTSEGSGTNIDLTLMTKGTGAINLTTNSSSSNIQASVIHVASAVNQWKVAGAATGNAPQIYVDGTDSNISLTLDTKGTGGHQFRTNVLSGAPIQLEVTHTASAVNRAAFTGAATGNPPSLTVTGSDTNIGFIYNTKGTGAHRFLTGGGSALEQVRILNVASAVNRINLSGSATGGNAQIYMDGSDTNIGLTIDTKGTGGLQFRSNVLSGAPVQFEITHTASAVNRVTATGGVTGTAPSLSATGSDTNIGLRLANKGTAIMEWTGQTTSGAAGAVAEYVTISINGTNRKFAALALA